MSHREVSSPAVDVPRGELETLVRDAIESAEQELASHQHQTEEPAPLATDVWIYRGVVVFLGLSAMCTLAGATWLKTLNEEAPQVLVALGSAAIGALAGLLAPAPNHTA